MRNFLTNEIQIIKEFPLFSFVRNEIQIIKEFPLFSFVRNFLTNEIQIIKEFPLFSFVRNFLQIIKEFPLFSFVRNFRTNEIQFIKEFLLFSFLFFVLLFCFPHKWKWKIGNSFYSVFRTNENWELFLVRYFSTFITRLRLGLRHLDIVPLGSYPNPPPIPLRGERQVIAKFTPPPFFRPASHP